MKKRIALLPILFVCLFVFISCLDITDSSSSLILSLPKSERAAFSSEEVERYNISIFGFGTEYSESKTAKPGDAVEFSELEADDYQLTISGFVGETKVASGSSQATVTEAATTHVQVQMKWLREKFTVTFETGDGSLVSEQTVIEENCALEPDSPTLENYTFEGWFTDSDLTGKFDFTTPITSDITLYAKWEKETVVKESFTVKFMVDDSVYEAQTVESGATLAKPAEPSKDAYTFLGWFTDSEGEKEFDFSSPITEEVTLYSVWELDNSSSVCINILYDDYTTVINFSKTEDKYTYISGDCFVAGGATLTENGDELILHVVPMEGVVEDEYDITINTADGSYFVNNDSTYGTGISIISWTVDGTDISTGWKLACPYVEYSFDIDSKKLSSEVKNVTEYTQLTSEGPTSWEDGNYYLASGEVTIDSRITIASDTTAYLILADGATLNVQGITMNADGQNLVIYGQSSGTGVLNAGGTYSGIGGNSRHGAGTITIHGGLVNATGTDGSAGIGATGNNGAFNGTVTIYNGTVTATGDGWGAGIGGTRNSWGSSGKVIVYGGSLTATGGSQGAGIGGGEGKPGGTLTVYGGYVKGVGGAGGPFTESSPAGIGGGGSYGTSTSSGNSEQDSNGGTVTIYGGTVEAYGDRGIGSGGAYGHDSEGTLTIEEGLTYTIISGESESVAVETTLAAYTEAEGTERDSYVKITVQ